MLIAERFFLFLPMTLDEFKLSISKSSLPSSLSNVLQAMWYDANGNWDKAHDIAQEIHNKDGAWIHAYLHRKEGDKGNASYWYHQAGQRMPAYSLDQEWEEITTFFLKNGRS